MMRMKKKILFYFDMKKNIPRSNFENLVGQFLDDMLVKSCANFYPNPKKSNAQETFLLSCFFVLFNICISYEINHKLP